jgi:hypothetical protein
MGNNAIKYGILTGVLSGIWILIMHFAGAYPTNTENVGKAVWLEYASVIIPAIGLYFGIKNYRDNVKTDKMEFFEGLFEGFKILGVGGVISAFFVIIYVQLNTSLMNSDFMYRVGTAVVVGMLFNLAISLILMNKQKHL